MLRVVSESSTLGLSTGVLDNRINLEFDWYKRNNFDLIGVATTQGIGGQITKLGNIAEMKSHGVELSLTTRNIVTRDFTWTTNFIYFTNACKRTPRIGRHENGVSVADRRTVTG